MKQDMVIQSEEEKILHLRAHHLMCSVLYVGKGYSDDFADNMTKVVKALRCGCKVNLQTRPDEICEDCPNRLKSGGCALDKQNIELSRTVGSLDEQVLCRFGLKTDTVYDSADIFSLIRGEICESDFDKWCGNCRWKEAGLCSFEKYTARISDFCGNAK